MGVSVRESPIPGNFPCEGAAFIFSAGKNRVIEAVSSHFGGRFLVVLRSETSVLNQSALRMSVRLREK